VVLVRHFMTRSVIALAPETSATAALELFRTHGIRRAPVMEHGKLVGIVAQSDLHRVLPTTVAREEQLAGLAVPVSAVMSSPVLTLGPEEHLEDAARRMLERKLGGLPVMESGELVGMLTESDIFRALIGMTTGEGEWRVTFQPKHAKEATLDPVLVALRAGCTIKGYLEHDRPGGERLHLLRMRGGRRAVLMEGLEQAGYVVIEVSSQSTH
jgi:acetoin utilization protein AcuB